MSEIIGDGTGVSPNIGRRKAIRVTLNGTKNGLGIKIVGGRNVHANVNFGVYIKQIIPGQLADLNGELSEGDQLIEANGVSLVGVSNEKAVEILRLCAASDKIDLHVARDIVAQSEFKRLSNKSTPTHPAQVITSSSAVSATVNQDEMTIVHRKDSTVSSEFVSVSDTSDSSFEKPEKDNSHEQVPTSLTKDRPPSAISEDHPPPPLPTSLPPTEDERTVLRFGREVQKIIFPKNKGLGIAVTGGIPLPISVAKIVAGMDAAQDGRMEVGDILISINGISFEQMKAEKAKTQLIMTGMATNENYIIEYKKPENELQELHVIEMTQQPDETVTTTAETSPHKGTYELGQLAIQKNESSIRVEKSLAKDLSAQVHVAPVDSNKNTWIATTKTVQINKISFPKEKGIGLVVASTEGNNSSISVAKIIPGMDTDKDGRIKVGDILVTVNGESFSGISNEKAQTKLILTSMNTKEFVIEYKSLDETDGKIKQLETNAAYPPLDSLPIIATSLSVVESTSSEAVQSAITFLSSTSERPPIVSKTIKLTKEKGLGISITGGVSESHSTPVSIVKIVPGLDVDKDGRMKIGDILININGISFTEVTTDKAQTQLLLAGMKAKQNDLQIIEFQRSSDDNLPSDEIESLNESITSSTDVTVEASVAQAAPIEHNLTQKPTPQTTNIKKGDNPILANKRLSVDPQNKFKLEKLIWALNYIGYKVTDDQEQQLTQALQPDEYGKVVYAEFVCLAQSMYSFKLEELAQALEQKAKSMLSQSQMSITPICTEQKPFLSIPPIPPKTETVAEVQQVLIKADSIETKLKQELLQSEKEKKEMERLLRSVQEENSNMKKEVIELKQSQLELTSGELSRRLAVKDCELRKKEKVLRRYEVAIEKLQNYIESCHDLLVNSPDLKKLVFHPKSGNESVMRGNPVTGNPRPPLYLSQHTKKSGTELVHEAKETLSAVRHILNASDLLPHGWEEEYGEDGHKYYVNHEMQITSWVHPETRSSSKPAFKSV